MVANVEADIWERVLNPEGNHFPPEGARAILQIGFRQSDLDRMNDLARRAREASLTSKDRAELESYNRIGHMLALLHSKARRSLQSEMGR